MQPKDITKNIGGVSPTNYVEQGVVDTSLSTAIRAVGGTALDVDKEIQSRRLDKELEALRTEYLTSAEPVRALEEGLFAESDRQELGAFAKQLKRGKLAMEQGRGLNFDTYRMQGETLLRTAIARRPGLAEDFRRIAANTLGTDVVGAKVLFLAGLEQANREGPKDTRDFEGMRAGIESVGLEHASLSNEQVVQVYQENFAKISQRRQQIARVAQAEELVKLKESGVTLNAPQNMVMAAGQLEQDNIRLSDIATAVFQQLTSGEPTSPEAAAVSLKNFTAMLSSSNNTFRAAWNGVLPDEQIDKMLSGRTEFLSQLQKYASGELTLNMQDNSHKYLLNTFRAVMDNDPNAVTMMAVKENFGEALAVRLSEESSTVMEGAVLAYTNLLSNTQMERPEAVASHAGQVVRDISQTVFNPRRATPGNETEAGILMERQNNAAQSLGKLPLAFLGTPDGSYKFGDYQLYMNRLATNASTMSRAMTDEQKAATVEYLPQSTAHFLYNIERAIATNPAYASLRGKVEIGLGEDGSIIRPKAGSSLTGIENEIVRKYNNLGVGRSYIDAMGSFLGVDAKTAAERVRIAAPQAPTDPSAARASGGSQRPTMEVTLGNGQPKQIDREGYELYSPVAQAKAEEFGISSSVLVNLITQESGWNPEARNEEMGTRGIAQVTGNTAKGLGFSPDNYHEPEQQIAAAAKYLSQLLKRYKGDYNLAVAAYNAGPGHLDTFLRTGERKGNLRTGGYLSGSEGSQTETHLAKVQGFDGDLLTYGREVMGIEDPETVKAELAATARKEREQG